MSNSPDLLKEKGYQAHRTPPRRRWVLWGSVLAAAVVVLALALGLGLGLGLKKKSSTTYVTTNTSFILDPNFEITSTPTTRYYEWTISEATGAPNGFERTLLVVNNQFPGPLIEVNSGDELVINVFNNLPNGTTLHWHGQLQNGTNFMDGTNGISQCPIPPGMNFTYRWTANPSQYGTFWWHAHTSTQYTDGIYGPLILHSPDEPIYGSYDQDVVIIMSDWYNDMSSGLLTQYLSDAGIDGSNYGGENPGAEPVPDAGLINGQTVGASFDFEANTTYRLRLINAATLTEFVFSVDNHTLSVVEADGTSLVPAEVHRVPINVAQRYSALLTTNQTAGTYYVRAEMQSICYKLSAPNLNTMVLGTMTYGAEPTTDVTSVNWADGYPGDCVDLNSTMTVPAIAMNPPNSTEYVMVTMSFQQTVASGGQQTLAFINNTSWSPDDSDPTILQVYSNGGSTSFDSSNLVVMNDQIQTVDLALNNYDDSSHPFHLHGHVFSIVSEGAGLYLPGISPMTLVNPVRRDTVSVPGYGYVVLRFTTDNPGVWPFHCHIGWHMAAGLLMQFASLPSQIQQFDIPDYLTQQCSEQSGGLVVGKRDLSSARLPRLIRSS